jgi:putative membrane protein
VNTMTGIALSFRGFCVAVILTASFNAVYAQSVSERWGINSLLGVSPSTEDFVTRVAQSEMLQVELAQLAEERGSEKTKEFVKGMLSEHRIAATQLKRLVSDRTVQVAYPMTLGSADKAKLEGLKKLTGPEFELEFDKAQVALHREMVSLFQRYGSGGSHADLKRFAYRHLPHMLEHWRLARER